MGKKLNLLTLTLIIVVLLLNFLPGFSQSDQKDPRGIVPEPSEDIPLEVDISTNRTRYLPEEEVKINYSLNRESYLYLFNVDPDGEVNLLFPNKYDRENKLEAGKGQLPRKGYSFLASATEGEEYFQAIVSPAELPLFPPPTEGSEKDVFRSLSDDPGSFAKDTSEELASIDSPDGWNTDWTSIQITKRTGRLTVTSTPSGAKIYVDENFRGRTPETIAVKPGTRKLRLLMGTDLRWTEGVLIESGESKKIQARLERIDYATVSISSDPPGAEIYVDGQLKGETPRRFSVEAGERTIELRKEGYLNREREISLYPNESRELSVELTSETDIETSFDFEFPFGLGLNLGGFFVEPFSPGLEISLNEFIAGISFYGNSDPDLPESINWKDRSYSGKKLDYGPTWEAYIGYPVRVYRNLYLRGGAGLSVQPQAQLEQLNSGGAESSLALAASVARNASLVYRFEPTFNAGLQFKPGNFSLQASLQSRRGPVIGFGYEF
ncbi:MAG: PEGA domain-containing protein [Candidatus Bipolaricaulota bacterium]